MTVVDTAGTEMTVLKAHVIERYPMDISIMPEGVLASLDDHQLRNLFKFLQSTELPK